MFANAGAYVEVTDAHQADGLGGIVGQAIECDIGWDVVAVYVFVGHGQILVDEFVHLCFDGFLLLSVWFPIEDVSDFALFSFDVGVA